MTSRRPPAVGDGRSLMWVGLLCVSALVAGCATPVGVERVDPRTVHRQLSGNVLSTGALSDFTQNALRLGGLSQLAEDDPAAALAAGHEFVRRGEAGPRPLFALAELAFKHAGEGGGQRYYLASALYAFAYLFPDDVAAVPDAFDPRHRWAVDLYNRALTRAFATWDGARVELRAGVYELPFGRLEVVFDPDDLSWAGTELTELVPAADLAVRGLRNRYRRPGLGAPLAARTASLQASEGFQVAHLPVPVTALLRIEDLRGGLASGRWRATLEIHSPAEGERTTVAGRPVPLEVEPTASLALGLDGSPIWATEWRGFLLGDLLRNQPTRLVAFQPHQPGRFPVVLVHGTASSAARWADLLNDLLADPRIRERFEFWLFGYETGNPIAYSALKLREALGGAVASLDPQGEDPALREMVLIGHSQGGLLVKLNAVETGSRLWDGVSRRPLDELRLRPESRELLRRSMFLEPEPFIGRVVFVATPHRGSYLTQNWLGRFIGGLVRLPLNLLQTTGDILTNNPDALRFDPERERFGSVFGMTPDSPMVTALAEIPVAPGIPAHSVIAVRGDGPVEQGGDGVVRFASAHLEGVESELIVRSGHSVQSHPEAVREVRRILLRHAEQACAAQGIGCPQPQPREKR